MKLALCSILILVQTACSNVADKNAPEAGMIDGAAELAQVAQAKIDTMAPGDYSYTSDSYQRRFNTTTAETYAAICSGLKTHTTFAGKPDAAGSFYATAYNKVIENNGMSVGFGEADSQGVCRVPLAFSGVVDGNSISFHKSCAVTQIVVNENKQASIRHVDPADCV